LRSRVGAAIEILTKQPSSSILFISAYEPLARKLLTDTFLKDKNIQVFKTREVNRDRRSNIKFGKKRWQKVIENILKYSFCAKYFIFSINYNTFWYSNIVSTRNNHK